MGSSENYSKRERQKARRSAKLQQQAAADAKSRRNRLLTFALLAVILLGLVGFAAAKKIASDNAIKAEKARVAALLDELGCTPDETQEDAGEGHLSNTELAASAPDTIYPDRPASSGRHFVNWLKTGVYDQQLDERALIHNLEHGYILGYYDKGADQEQVTAFKERAQARIDDDLPKIIVSPWDGDLQGEANFAYVAWNQRQMCAEYDAGVFDLFAEAHHSGNGVAPEKGITPHTEEGGGTIDPGDEPFLLPPLGTAGTPTEGSSEVPAQGGTTEGSS